MLAMISILYYRVYYNIYQGFPTRKNSPFEEFWTIRGDWWYVRLLTLWPCSILHACSIFYKFLFLPYIAQPQNCYMLFV